MSDDSADRIINSRLERAEEAVPGPFRRVLRWLRGPAGLWVRLPLGVLLIVAGFLGFLPILGFWMVPLGLVLLSLDLTFLKRPVARLLVGGERWWRQLRARFAKPR